MGGMQIIESLERALAGEESPFRAQLLREDIARLRRLAELARQSGDAESFRKAGMRIGWTPGDARTAELAEPLGLLLDAVYEKQDARIVDAWNSLHRLRMERLLGCLSTPTPKPVD